MINNIDNGYATDYGIHNTSLSVPLFSLRPKALAQVIYQPNYLAAGTGERKAVDAKKYFVPGILEGHSLADNATYIESSIHIYKSGLELEGEQQFLDARAGFENQMKKVIVASSDAEFDRQLQALCTYAEENGYTEDLLEEFTEMFLEANRKSLKKAGIID